MPNYYYGNTVELNLEDFLIRDVEDYSIENDEILFTVDVNNIENFSPDDINDFLLSTGSDDDFFIEVFFKNFETQILRKSAYAKPKKVKIIDGTYKLSSFEITPSEEGINLSFRFSIERDENDDNYE